MSISAAAYEALQRLDDGERLNTTHRLARELIAANLAHAGFGILEITEAGRISLRRGVVNKAFIVEDDNVASLGGMSVPCPPSPPPPPLVPDNPDHVPSPVPP